MQDKELDKANKGYAQHYKDEKAENIATREMIAGPLRKAKDYVVDKLKSMDQRTLQQVTTDKMDQRSIEDVVKGKSPKYKDEVVKKAKGGMVKSSASKRADGCAQRGKTRGRMI